MNFKKDYINYVLHSILQSEFYGVRDDNRVRKVLEKIISIPDTAKATYLTGKTAGLEMLFKYLLYISDKVDKSQITVFNLRNNYEYDLQNLKKICGEIKNYKTAAAKKETVTETKEEESEAEITEVPESSELTETKEVAEDTSGEVPEPENAGAVSNEAVADESESDADEFSQKQDEQEEFTLIENSEKEDSDEEVFGLAGISRSVDLDLPVEPEEPGSDEETEPEAAGENIPEEDIIEESKADEFQTVEIGETEEYEDEIVSSSVLENIESEEENVTVEEKEDFEFEIKKEVSEDEAQTDEESSDDTAASEVYYKFENRFFEDVKILEKLFSNINKACKGKELEKPGGKTLQSFTEIIAISNELADLTRQLEFDLTADIFLTINLLFTRSIKTPSLIFPGRIELLKSVLNLVTNLIKGEDYLGQDEIVNEMEILKEELKKPAVITKKESKPAESTASQIKKEPEMEKPEEQEKAQEHIKAAEEERESEKELNIQKDSEEKEKPQAEAEEEDKEQSKTEEKHEAEEIRAAEEKPKDSVIQENTSGFKMKYLVKEFEKNFLNLGNIEGEYSKYEILEAVDEMNELLRMLAKISASVKNADVLKLSEVSYVFLKYLKDYKMDLLDKEIQQIIKYIIFTYKMLLTNRMPEDFEKLVQYLNNPVKIFTDS